MINLSKFICVGLALLVSGVRAEPLVSEKLVLAHYMTRMVPSPEGERVWDSPELYDPQGRTAAIGGLYLSLPMWTQKRPNMSLSEAVDFEIRTARAMGVDGFQFYYPFYQKSVALDSYNEIIREFIRVADARYPGFKVSLCLSLGGRYPEMTEAERVETWGSAIQRLLQDTAASPAWLRTRDGALLFYHWATEGFAEEVHHMARTADEVKAVAGAFQKLAKYCGEEIAWVYHVRKLGYDPDYVSAILTHFPAVWGWVESDEESEFWDDLAKHCEQEGVAYTQTVYPDYFTSKAYARGDEHYQLLSVDEALQRGEEGIERHYRQTDLAKGQALLLQAAIDRKAQIINYATWNDWPEGHQLAPEINHNFGPSLLLRHFAAKWRGEPRPFEDVAIAFFKKHRSTATPTHSIHVKVKSRRNDPVAEDEVQLVTILSAPAEVVCNGSSRQVPEGFTITSFPMPEDTRVKATVIRNGRVAAELETPVEITSNPNRTDRLTYSYSSRHDQELNRVFDIAEGE